MLLSSLLLCHEHGVTNMCLTLAIIDQTTWRHVQDGIVISLNSI
jgi:hypothetical protein